MGGSAGPPLRGVRILNFGWIWAGAVMGQVLGDLGAQVVRIESAMRPDISRLQGISYGAVNIGRSQYSAALNLKASEARQLLMELVRVSDVVMDNYRPGTMQAAGLGYEQLRKVNPTVIVLSTAAAGQSGPLSSIATYGSNVSCLGGLDSVQGYDAGGPVPAGISIVDPLYATCVVYAVLAALVHRRKTGQGQFIDNSQWEFTAGLMGGPFMDYVMNGRVQGPMGNRDLLMAPHSLYPCLGDDRWVAIAVGTERQWRALCEAMGAPNLADEPRFADGFRRQRNWEALHEIISRWTRKRDRWAVTEVLQERGVPAFPLFSDADAFQDRHYWARRAWVRTVHPQAGNRTVAGVVWKLSRTPGRMDKHCPALGEDGAWVFGDILGLPASQVHGLVASKVLY